MARIFNIYFEHEGTEATALVSVHTNPFFTEYTLSGLSPDLATALSIHKLISRQPGQLFFQGVPQHQLTPLMRKIIRAVAEHLEQVTSNR